MSIVSAPSWVPASLPVAGAVAGASQENLIIHHVQLALASAVPERKGMERRRETRHPYPYPVHLTPVDTQGRALPDEAPVTVLGRHISNHGLDFNHLRPLPWRRVIASLPSVDERWIGLLMDLTWCRFSQHGWYDNGGRFLGVVGSPLNG